MARYSPIPVITYTEDSKRGYATTKYPEIPAEFVDTYVYTNRGDRYDTLALTYYGDPSLYWIISRANPNITNLDSLIPTVGEQIRIPAASRISTILSDFDSLNQ